MNTKATLFETSEALRVLNGYADMRFPGTGSSISMKIFDISDLLAKKAEFLTKETRKIIEEYNAVAEEEGNPQSNLVVYGQDNEIDPVKTRQFLDEVIALRNTEIELDIPNPFTPSEIRDHIPLTAIEYGLMRFLIGKEEEQPEPKIEVIGLG